MVRPNSLVSVLALAAARAAAEYTLVDHFDKSNFFDGFDFFSEADPTRGFVKYVTPEVANNQGLAGFADSMVYMGVDHKTEDPATGRASVRVSSKKTYTKGLFVADIAHMPVGCGVWPALWTFGPNWPSSGEIDILEGVNSQATNAVTLHTAPGCVMKSTGSAPKTKFKSDGNCNAGKAQEGCSLNTADKTTYGEGFNAVGGGVYAMEWTSDAISVWFFPRGSPQAAALSGTSGAGGNVTLGFGGNGTSSFGNGTAGFNGNGTSGFNGNSTAGAGGRGGRNGTSAAAPDTASFGTPLATFSGCDIDSHFREHQIVINTSLCGEWAGRPEVWDADETCSAKAKTCQAYVAGNSDAFADAYWLIQDIKVYQKADAGRARERLVRKFVA